MFLKTLSVAIALTPILSIPHTASAQSNNMSDATGFCVTGSSQVGHRSEQSRKDSSRGKEKSVKPAPAHHEVQQAVDRAAVDLQQHSTNHHVVNSRSGQPVTIPDVSPVAVNKVFADLSASGVIKSGGGVNVSNLRTAVQSYNRSITNNPSLATQPHYRAMHAVLGKMVDAAYSTQRSR